MVRIGPGLREDQSSDPKIVSRILAVVVLPECRVIGAELMADAARRLSESARTGRRGLNWSIEPARENHRL